MRSRNGRPPRTRRSWLRRAAVALIDAFHRSGAATPRVRFQARFAAGASLLAIAVAVPSAAAALAAGDHLGASLIGAFALLVGAQLAALRAGAPVGVLAWSLVATVGLFLVADMLIARDLGPQQPFWLVVLPLSALVLEGPHALDSERPGPPHAVLVATAVAIALGVLVFVAHTLGLTLDRAAPVDPAWVTALDFGLFMAATFGLLHLYALSVRESEDELRQLRELLAVCAWCKRIRDGDGWVPLERYVAEHHRRDLTHGICPSCDERLHLSEAPGAEEGGAGGGPRAGG